MIDLTIVLNRLSNDDLIRCHCFPIHFPVFSLMVFMIAVGLRFAQTSNKEVASLPNTRDQNDPHVFIISQVVKFFNTCYDQQRYLSIVLSIFLRNSFCIWSKECKPTYKVADEKPANLVTIW